MIFFSPVQQCSFFVYSERLNFKLHTNTRYKEKFSFQFSFLTFSPIYQGYLVWLFGFYGISTFVGYSMPNLVLISSISSNSV